MEYAEYVRSYAAKSNDELLRLQLESKDLALEASAALTTELAKRGISGADQLNAFRERENRRKVRESKNPGNLFIASRLGVGRWYLGKTGRVADPSTGIERFSTTVFLLVLWFPLVPTGSYLVEKRRGFLRGKITVLKKLPLNWGQVLRVWAVAACGLLAVIWLLKRI